MVLERAKRLVQMGTAAAREMLPGMRTNGRFPDAHLWILSHGFFNGFNSVIETLKNVEMNQGDPLLREAIRSWLNETDDDRKAAQGNWRNQMTHQGRALTTLHTVSWETDDWNDTVFPVHSHVFAELGVGDDTRPVTFGEWALSQFLWLDRGLRDIEVRYRRLQRKEARRLQR